MTEAELGLFIELTVQRLWVLHLSDNLFPERGTAENFSWCSWSSWLFPMTGADSAEVWLFLLGPATTAAIPTQLNWVAGVSVKCL